MPLSINKISRPRMSGILPRERLFQLLDRGIERPVTWVQGPGGSGKSTLVASYLDHHKLPAIWYQVDSGDTDIATLFYYMGLAAKQAVPHSRHPLPLFTPEYQLGVATFARRYFENLFARLKPPYVLVLDDYHEVGPDSMFHDIVKDALTEVPHGISVIVISRMPPPPAMARLCAGKQMSYIGWDDLQLTAEETAGIVRLHDRAKEWQPALDQLHDRIQGWVAGLVLLLERGKAGELAQWLAGKSPQQDIFNYFAEELFDKAEAGIRDFLLKTALLPTIAPDLAERLTENPDAPRILAGLHGSNFFTEKRTDGGLLYRFHPLFREYLLSKLELTYAPDQLTRLKRTASLLLEESGRIEEAALLCINAEEWERLAGLILDHAQNLLSQGRNRTVLEWLGHLPLPLQEQTPYLLFWSGAAFISSDPVESRSRFRLAFTQFLANGDRTGLFLSWCAVVDTAIHASEYVHLGEWIEILDEVLKEEAAFPSREIEVRVSLSLFNAVAFGLPNHPDVKVIRERAYLLICTEKIADANLFLSSGIHLVVHFIYQGDFTRAGLVLDLLRGAARSTEATDLVRIMVNTIEAQYAFATCSLDACIDKAFEALALAAETGICIWDTHNYGHALAAALARDDENLIAELVPKMSAGIAGARSVDRAYYHWLMAWHSALHGEFFQASQHLEFALKFVSEIGFLAPETAVLINMAEICLELGNERGTAAWLEKAHAAVKSMDSAYLSFCYLITDSTLRLNSGDDAKGAESLRKAFALGREIRIENFYFWRPALMTRLCMKALEAGIEEEYAVNLIRKRRLFSASPPLAENWPWPVRIYTLGRFELVKGGKAVVFSGKVQKKPLEMLKALVALGGEESREGQLADLLWPEADGDTARNSFKVTLHRLRELLGVDKGLQLQEGRLAMDRRYFWTDAWAFESLLEKAQINAEAKEGEEAIALAGKALSLYRGHFLAEEDKPWVEQLRGRLAGKYLLHVMTLGSLSADKGDFQQAIGWFERSLEIDGHQEQLYQGLMSCYLAAGQRSQTIATYNRCRKILAAELGMAPSAAATAIYRQALAGE